MRFVILLPVLFFKNYLLCQCTPTNCLSSLPAHGGLCDTALMDASVNQPYNDYESFHITTACFDAGFISPANAGTNIRVIRYHDITYSGLPSGCGGNSNQSVYLSPANGCLAISGTPTQAGRFKVNVDILSDINAYPFGCSSFSVAQNNNPVSYKLDLLVKPDPTFSLASSLCLSDAPVPIVVNGTTGGTFFGNGIIGNIFDPSVAGVGIHQIKYVVSAQEGSAYASASDSSTVIVEVVSPSYQFFVDSDGDGYGAIGSSPIQSCSSVTPSGYSQNNLDCNDQAVSINPDSPEVCDNSDNNCDGNNDEGLTLINYYVDADNDGYGAIGSTPIQSCSSVTPSGYSQNNLDCNDQAVSINPDSPEVCDNSDNNCDGNNDEGLTLINYYVDADNDGYGAIGSAPIQNCSSTIPSGYSQNNLDCNDQSATINPGSPEVCDNTDNNCDGNNDEGLTLINYYVDADSDGYGAIGSTPIQSCSSVTPSGYSQNNLDCNDQSAIINPISPEVCDNTDNNCDGNNDEGLTLFEYYIDSDGDGYGSAISVQSCESIPGPGISANFNDCDDSDELINPDASEIVGNGIDENCDGQDGDLNVIAFDKSSFVNFFPNPANERIKVASSVPGIFLLRIYNLCGGQIYQWEVDLSTKPDLDISFLGVGSYFIEFTHENTGYKNMNQLLIVR